MAGSADAARLCGAGWPVSAPDIGVLRALSEAHTDAWGTVFATKDALLDAVESVLISAFGDRCGKNRGERAWNVSGARVVVWFERSRGGAWLAETGTLRHGPYARADTPTAAVHKALAALAATHPTEAAALRAAIPNKEPTP